ncbi:MOB kinase activator 2-like isoform X1 [Polyodon spathula]|uniref:MOB kinase activator 2-like isoform X1 n=1 Tax=Polyodon spathula TaxID=7913 RepID=UPI001B7F4167|nr:MOB kinase activator 2-like isoform X1 [Polyodon spathula]
MGGCHSMGRSASVKHSPRKQEFINLNGPKLKNNDITKSPCSLTGKPYLQPGCVSERIVQVDLKTLVSLPNGVDKAEWMATNTIAFFKHINVLSGAVSELCTGTTCPTTSAAGKKTYYWQDDHGKRVKCSGPLYTDYAMSYIQELLTDEKVFPTKNGSTFPSGFVFMVQKIFLYLFHIMAHLYWAHYRDIARLELHPHLNTLYAHFMAFNKEFGILDPQETAIMDDLTTAVSKHSLY